jgi:hypothetical protein
MVHDCYANVGDDGFGIKSGRDEEGRKVARPTEYVTYTRLHVGRAHGVCVIGSESSGGVRHVRFIDCDGDGTDAGIRIKSTRGRGGIVEDIVADNIRLTNVKTAILLSMRYTQTPPEPVSERTPLFRDIHLSNITGTNITKCATIEGLDERDIQNISLQNINLSGTTGISLSNAKNITFQNIKIAVQNPPSLSQDHTSGVQTLNWQDLPYTRN